MHEVAENWDITVAQFLYERGADVQCSDANGKTPLHIAASIDHKDMIVWLIKHGADLEARTSIEKQTPLHHATRSDSMLSLQTLIEHGGTENEPFLLLVFLSISGNSTHYTQG